MTWRRLFNVWPDPLPFHSALPYRAQGLECQSVFSTRMICWIKEKSRYNSISRAAIHYTHIVIRSTSLIHPFYNQTVYNQSSPKWLSNRWLYQARRRWWIVFLFYFLFSRRSLSLICGPASVDDTRPPQLWYKWSEQYDITRPTLVMDSHLFDTPEKPIHSKRPEKSKERKKIHQNKFRVNQVSTIASCCCCLRHRIFQL